MAATKFYDFLNELLGDDEKILVLPALRQDPFIFAALQADEAVGNMVEARESIQSRMMPGVFALAAVHPLLVESVLKGGKLPTDLLEKVMTDYENHKQDANRAVSLETAVDLALALIEKRKIVSHWKLILNDIFKNKTSSSEISTDNRWISTLMIASQLDAHSDEINECLSAAGGSKAQHSIFVHCVMAKNEPTEEKISKLAEAFINHGEGEQVRLLSLIQEQAGHVVAEKVAKALLNAETTVPSEEISTSAIWSNPEEHLKLATRYQKLGMISRFALDNEKAQSYIEAANFIVEKFHHGLRVQKISASIASGEKESSLQEAIEIRQQNPGDSEILTEILAAVEPLEDGALINTLGAVDSPALDYAKAKSIEAAGNPALAREAAVQTFHSMTRDPRIFSARFTPAGSLQRYFDLMAHYDLPVEAAAIARKLLKQNPADMSLIQKSAPVFFQAGEFREALDLYQSMELLNPADVDIKRAKALIFEKTGQDFMALDTWTAIRELTTPVADEDLLHLANTANRLGNVDTAIEAASAIPEGSDVFTKSLISLGKSYRLMGNHPKAIQCLAKAIEMEVTDEEPWLALAEQYSETGELDRSVETLKAARSVFPESKEIPFELAKRLLQKNSPSEALSLLVDLTNRDGDFLPGQLLTVKTMKALHHEGVDAKIDELVSRFPDSAEVNFLQGQQYLENGFRPEARVAFSKAVSGEAARPEWSAAYADALAGADYQHVNFSGAGNEKDETTAMQSLEKSGLLDADPLAVAVQAEVLLSNGDAAAAFKAISTLEAKQVSPDSEWLWRLQAGMARAALMLGKFDVALASIQDAIDQKPGLAGLHQILANVHQAAGDTLAAVEAANQVLLIAPDVVENVLWFVRFLSGMGRQDEAEKELQKAIARKPEETKYKLALADLLVQTNRETELKETLVNVNSLLQANLDEADLVHAAELYFKMSDLNSAATLLQQRLDRKPESVTAILDLAGVLSLNNQNDRAFDVLGKGSADEADSLPALIRAQMLYDRSNIQEANQVFSSISEKGRLEFTGLASLFLPEAWITLLQQPDPAAFLRVKIEFACGDFQKALAQAQSAMKGKPQDGWMSFLKDQSKLALGEDLEPAKDFISNLLPPPAAYELAQRSVDAGEAGQALKWIDGIISGKDSEWESAIRAQVAAIRGELIEADINAEEVNSAVYSGGSWVKAEEVAKVRSLTQAALARRQWNDAVETASSLYHSNIANRMNAALAMKVIATTLEFAESAHELDIKVHAPSAENLASGKAEINELLPDLEGARLAEAKRWSLRGKLVLEPNAANIRSLAMIPPQPGDITAMMGALHAMGDDATAIQVAKKFESHPQVMAKLAECMASSDKVQALTMISRSLQIIDAQPDVWVARSMLEEQLGEKENAVQSMENALSYWPEETGWHIRAAHLWQAAGDLKKAVAHLNLAAEQEEQSTDLQYLIGSAYLSLGKFPEAIRILESASEREMNRADILATLAEAFHQAGNNEKALKTAERANAADPFTVKPLLLTGEIALEKGDTTKALDHARQAISRDEKNADAITFLAKVLLKKGDKAQALAALEKAADSDEATLDLMLKHAHLVREIKGAADSKSIFEGLVRKYPQNTELHKLLAESQWECGDKVAAEETARQSLRIDGNQPELHGFLGKLKLENGNLDQAIQHFTEQISLDKEQMSGYLNLAKVYQQQREFHKALDTLQQAIEANPQDPRAFLAAAGMLKDSKDYASAEVMLRKAAAIDPNDVNIKRQLGAVIALNLVHKSQQESSKL